MTLEADFMLRVFHTEDNAYLYCGKTNQIFLVRPVMVKIIPLYGQCSLDEIQQRLGETFTAEDIADSYSIIDRLAQQNNLFQRGGLRTIFAPIPKDRIRTELDRDFSQLILEATESCNMRCHYCAYSGGYANIRQHGARSMPKGIAQAAIDFFFQKNREREEPFVIGFYGGEPLLQVPLIKFCVEYARSLPWKYPDAISFNMTTNGTLLDDDSIHYLVDNQFLVMVSLDGPAEDHDAHRVDASGNGTFSRVMANLNRFNKIAPDTSHLSISCLMTPTTDLLRLNDFFVQHQDLFSEISMATVMPGHQTFFSEYPDGRTRRKQQLGELCKLYAKAHLQPGTPVPERRETIFMSSLFARDYVTLHRRNILDQALSEEDFAPACFPGKRRLFVDVQGKFHICERIENTCSIGDVRSGFHIPTIQRLLDEYLAVMNREECLHCWAFRFCSACFANMVDSGHVSLETTQKMCSDTRERLTGMLRTYCGILERNPSAFDYMDNVEIG